MFWQNILENQRKNNLTNELCFENIEFKLLYLSKQNKINIKTKTIKNTRLWRSCKNWSIYVGWLVMDAPALNRANIGIAVAAAWGASDIVLTKPWRYFFPKNDKLYSQFFLLSYSFSLYLFSSPIPLCFLTG